jgi:GAF domain-containing protein
MTGQVVHVPDLATDVEFAHRSFVGAGLRGSVSVPMLREDVAIGAITVTRQESRSFTDKQIALLENFAAQAVIAIEKARLLSKLRESLEQQTATSDILASISGSLTDPRPVFNVIVHNLRRLFGARFATVQLLQGETIEMPAADGEVATEKIMQHYPRPLDNTSVGGQAMLTNKVVQHAPVLDNPVVPAAAQQMARDYQYNSIIAAPMIRHDTVVGAIVCGNPEPRVFDEKEVALIKSFAAQAVIAIENARLLTELRQRTDDLCRSVGELRALGEVSQAVNSTLDLETVLDTIVAKAVQLSNTDAGAIYVYGEQDSEFHLRATYGMAQELIDALSHARISVSEQNVNQMLTQRQPVHVADLSQGLRSPVDDIILSAGYRARLVAPLTTSSACWWCAAARPACLRPVPLT